MAASVIGRTAVTSSIRPRSIRAHLPRSPLVCASNYRRRQYLLVLGVGEAESTVSKDTSRSLFRPGTLRRAIVVGALPFLVAALHTKTDTRDEDTWDPMRRLIQHLQQTSNLPNNEHRLRIHEVMQRVDRRLFVPSSVPDEWAVADTPIPIGHGQTISAPHMHEICLYQLRGQLVPGAHVLDVGSGSGYLTACLGHFVRGHNGRVVGIEKVPELAAQSIRNIQAASPELIEDGTVAITNGDVLSALPEVIVSAAPFDAIHVGAAARTVYQALVDLLKPGGVMIIPVGSRESTFDSGQVLTRVDKDQFGEVHMTPLNHVRYVPLTEPHQRW